MARVRKQPGTKEALMQYASFVVLDPQQYKGIWQDCFPKKQPLYIEIGMGKGRFISTMARKYPEYNFIGIELVEEVILCASKRIEQSGGFPENLRLVWMNANQLQELFRADEVSRIYLNFSDPWPKSGHKKRRLTHENFLQQYREVLVPEGEVHFKTDNQGLFEFSLNEFSRCQWQLKNIQLDLYQKLPEDNVATEYELKFHLQGMPIYRLEACKRISHIN